MRFVFAVLFCAPQLMVQSNAAHTQQKKPVEKKKPATKAPLPFKTFKENFSYGFGSFSGQRVYQIMMGQLRPGVVNIDRKKLAAAIRPGKDIATGVTKSGLEIDSKRLNEGFTAALRGDKALINDAQMRELFDVANKQIIAGRKKRNEKTKKQGEAFLAANKMKDGVKTTKSGLQYKVLRKGKGPSPKLTDFVVTHYHGMRIDGTVFDSSVDRKKPYTLMVGGPVIKGWREALQLMKKGSKWRIFVPADLAYAERGKGDIGPHTVLIFELELIDIKAPPKFKPRGFKP